jgi:hypothetical protein
MLDIFGGNETRTVGTVGAVAKAQLCLLTSEQQFNCPSNPNKGSRRICDQRHSSPQPQPQLVHELLKSTTPKVYH